MLFQEDLSDRLLVFAVYLMECLHQKAVDDLVANEDRSAAGMRNAMEQQAAAGASARLAADEGVTASLLGGAAGGNATGPARGGGGGVSGLVSNRRSTPLYTAQGRLRGGMVHSQGFENPEAMFELLRRENPDGLKHDWTFGLGWMKEWEMGEEWLNRCMKGVLQYVVMQVVFAVTLLITKYVEIYGEGCLFLWGTGTDTHGDPYPCYKVAYPYTTFVISCSQMYALYCLVHFYHGTSSALAHIRPKAKFISIKMIVFFNTISVLAPLGLNLIVSDTRLIGN